MNISAKIPTYKGAHKIQDALNSMKKANSLSTYIGIKSYSFNEIIAL